ncbi:DUF29 domain-containing protein [Azohydromonas aeria]|uniref:DUF29 domain-containing protein n=1 Tax=Azohydromonas aeria TaxID=2590212 RepID=UPI0012F7E942|nr:DUF29 domain-containing protein [Azohydromonas aeria]
MNAYDKDIVAWANQQSKALRDGRFDLLDIEHVAEEIEDVGRSEQREFARRLAALLTHLLKWQVQPERRCIAWKNIIAAQRPPVLLRLKRTPSLESMLSNPGWLGVIWIDAVADAVAETGLAMEAFPQEWCWSVEDVLSDDFLPG